MVPVTIAEPEEPRFRLNTDGKLRLSSSSRVGK
jgi:hypothetical protein